jgi:ATP-dependent protease ClpP protease subunit
MKESKTVKPKAGYEDMNVPFDVSYLPEKTGRWIIEINDGIESSGQFDYAVRALELADEDNPVQVNLQCPGGSLDAADRFIHAMRKCRGHIHIVATGGCHSAATLILLEADSFELSENFNALIHCGSLGTIGNLNEYTAQTTFSAQFMPNVFRKSYEGFLTEEELEGMIKGCDIWVDAQGWVDRWNRRNDYFKAKVEEANKPAKKPRKKKVEQEPEAVIA